MDESRKREIYRYMASSDLWHISGLKMAEEPDSKRAKLNDENDHSDTKPLNNLEKLSEFTPERVIHNDASSKRAVVVCSTKNEDKAIVIMEKSPFTEAESSLILQSKDTILEEHASNDIYTWYDCLPPAKLNRIKMTVIRPATEQHFTKYSYKEQWILRETPKDYQDITKPWIDSLQMKIQWVYNILEGKDEVDRVVLNDGHPELGFILLPDMKWDGKTIEELYLLAIVKARGLGSLRDLRGNHVPLLKNLRDKSMVLINKKYGLASGELRVFFHHLPSYYHLHVHFMNVRQTNMGSNSHYLEDVIQNLEMDSDYYGKKTFTLSIPKDEVLYKLYQEAGRF